MRFICTQLIVLLLIFSSTAAIAAPLISSEAAYLLNADTNQVLYEKNGNKILLPASTSKIMTAFVALKYGKPDSVVTVSANAAALEGSSMNLRPGDQLTLDDMLRGMMTVSGNDAAQAVAEHVGGGSEANFVELMNREAAALGANNTHFANPHGLPAARNYSTAHDLAIITARAYHQPGFVDYVSQKYQTIHFINRNTNEKKESINELLDNYPGCNGVKSGTTREAGDCLVAAAKQNGVQLIAVVLKSQNRWQDAANLLDYGFQQVGQQPPASSPASSPASYAAKPAPLPNAGNANSQLIASGSQDVLMPSDQPGTELGRLLEFSASGGGSYNAAYLYPVGIFGASYAGPVLAYDSGKVDVGLRMAWPNGYDGNLLEVGIYTDNVIDCAYLFALDNSWGADYVGPVIRYNTGKSGKTSLGVRFSIQR